ncbi:hypothetical protein [Chitinophaga oryziterrae]|jgi:hypothetical protein|uniref:hypothetical protein n=1 Tax=Chitinophaga oryziterrae TaxID=1031224 RepID=UPI001478A070|nr:hypothetical protein [Chitinophaga oryziterrae]
MSVQKVNLREQRFLARVERMKSLGLDPDKILSIEQKAYLYSTLSRNARFAEIGRKWMEDFGNK